MFSIIAPNIGFPNFVSSYGFVKDLEEMRKVITKSWEDVSIKKSYAKGWIKIFLKEGKYYTELCG